MHHCTILASELQSVTAPHAGLNKQQHNGPIELSALQKSFFCAKQRDLFNHYGVVWSAQHVAVSQNRQEESEDYIVYSHTVDPNAPCAFVAPHCPSTRSSHLSPKEYCSQDNPFYKKASHLQWARALRQAYSTVCDIWGSAGWQFTFLIQQTQGNYCCRIWAARQ